MFRHRAFSLEEGNFGVEVVADEEENHTKNMTKGCQNHLKTTPGGVGGSPGDPGGPLVRKRSNNKKKTSKAPNRHSYFGAFLALFPKKGNPFL